MRPVKFTLMSVKYIVLIGTTQLIVVKISPINQLLVDICRAFKPITSVFNQIEVGCRWAPQGKQLEIHSLWIYSKMRIAGQWREYLGPAQIKDKRPHISHF